MLDFIALDLEGTLISNAVSQIPRPGLKEFLETCAKSTRRIVIYSAINLAKCRAILKILADEQDVPAWFAHAEIVEWDYRNGEVKKDLTLIQTEWSRGVLVDDIQDYVEDNQLNSWTSINNFDGYTKNDNELARVAKLIKEQARTLDT